MNTKNTTSHSEKADISFIVPAKNEQRHIENCLSAIVNASIPGIQTQIIVVDNGSTDSTVDIAKKYTNDVYIRPELSISAMRNFAASIADGKYLAFIDADVTVEKNWIQAALSQIRESDAAMVGASPKIPSDSTWVTKTWHIFIANRATVTRRQWLASMNMLVDKAVFQSVGGFDEKLLTCEDVDLGYKIARHHEIVHDTRIVAVHHGEATTLRELFLKERWRGTSIYEGALRHGLTLSEIPSLLQPIMTILGVTGLIVSMVSASLTLAIAAFLLLMAFPAAKTLQIASSAACWSSMPKLMVIWTVYSFARASSAYLELKRHLLTQSNSTVSRHVK